MVLSGQDWYCHVAGQQYGPVSLETLRAWISQGRVRQPHLVWTQGMVDWAPAGSIPALFPPAGSAATSAAVPGNNGLCIAGMILGVLSIASSCMMPKALILSLAGLGLSIAGIHKARSEHMRYGLGVVGLVTSILGLTIAVAWIVLFGAEFFAGWCPLRHWTF